MAHPARRPRGFFFGLAGFGLVRLDLDSEPGSISSIGSIPSRSASRPPLRKSIYALPSRPGHAGQSVKDLARNPCKIIDLPGLIGSNRLDRLDHNRSRICAVHRDERTNADPCTSWHPARRRGGRSPGEPPARATRARLRPCAALPGPQERPSTSTHYFDPKWRRWDSTPRCARSGMKNRAILLREMAFHLVSMR